MNLSDELIVRTVGRYVHILNPFTGKLVSLSIKDFKLLKDAGEKDIDTEILKTIQIPSKKTLKTISSFC
jgi:hypothetical protein